MEANSENMINCKSPYKRLLNNKKPMDSGDGKRTKPYRLTIQIDKIYLRPCPKSKKINQININIPSSQKNPQEIIQDLQCLVCKKDFSFTSELYTHLKDHFVCDICDTEFSSQTSYKKHSKIHQSEIPQQPFKCHICDKLFDTKEAIKKHSHISLDKYNDLEENRVHYCKTCNMTFRNETVFRKHLASHVEKLPNSSVKDQKQTTVTSQMSAHGQLRPN